MYVMEVRPHGTVCGLCNIHGHMQSELTVVSRKIRTCNYYTMSTQSKLCVQVYIKFHSKLCLQHSIVTHSFTL